MTKLAFPTGRKYDLACLGRLAVDLYAQQIGSKLEDANSFAKYLGGSSANMAFGAARLGIKSTMISRVGDEHMGRFLIQTLQQEGCDTTMVQVDPQRLTGLVLLGLKDQHTFPLIFYRENCADMALDANLITEKFIASCRALIITGTHLSKPTVREATVRALDYAKKNGTINALDIDYRPVLWGLTGRGEGENRYVANAEVTNSIQEVLPKFDLIIGTEEEFLIAGGVPNNLIASLNAVRKCTNATLVVKLGALGCAIIEDAIPQKIEDAPTVHGRQVKVMNVLGAGDAFAAGLMTGLLQGKSIKEAANLANICGAIVVSRHGCAPAMPTPAEVKYWDENPNIESITHDEKINHLHRVSKKRADWSELNVLAFDHRSQLYELAIKCGVDESKISQLKLLLVQAVANIEQKLKLTGKIGVLIDGKYGEEALAAATGRKWWVGRPVELPSSRPLNFDSTKSIGSELIAWPIEQTIKCLVFYHPADPIEMRLSQESKLQELWQASRISGHELLIEVILPTTKLDLPNYSQLLLRVIKRFYNIGIKPEWWKLPPQKETAWDELANIINYYDPYCRGATILGLDQPLAELKTAFMAAKNPIVKGFMVGRSIWGEAAKNWFSQMINDQEFINKIESNFSELINTWHNRKTK